MTFKFSAQQKMLSLSECQHLCAISSRDAEELAFQGGWHGIPGERLKVPVGVAINMLVLSAGTSHGVEWQAMREWLPGLKNETLLKLGENASNWSFEDAGEAQKQFWPMLYGPAEAVRPQIAPLLGCCFSTTTRQLRFHSQSDVECLSNSQFDHGYSGRTPRFTIDAHAFAGQVQAAFSVPLFTAKAAPAPY